MACLLMRDESGWLMLIKWVCSGGFANWRVTTHRQHRILNP
jgi:hypothetical protein